MSGVLQVKKIYLMHLLFFNVDFQELRNRIVNRATEDEETINLRMKNAENEVKFINEYDC